MKFNPLDKSGFTFAVSTLWGKVLDKFSSLSKVASSGKYIDLTGRPTKLSEFTNDVGFKTTDTTYGVVSKTANGLAPKLPNETTTTKYLRQDGTWAVPPNTTYGNMSGASTSAAGKAGLVPAPGAGMQDAVLMGKGAWGKLGAAAMYNVANNDTTTEEGFLADARRVKALRDDFNALNSALENIGGGNIPSESYVYVIRTGSNTSFSALVVGTGVSGTTGTTLDVIHNDIGKYNTGLENISSGPYRAVLFKTSSSAYCGILMCNYMHEIKSYGLPVYFSYFNNGVSEAYSIFAPELCS